MTDFMIRLENKADRDSAESLVAFGRMTDEIRNVLNQNGFDLVCVGLSEGVTRAFQEEKRLEREIETED